MTENSSLGQGNRLQNLTIALVATILSVALFLGLQSQTKSVSLQAQAEQSTPLDVAIANGKPTLIEFYADWCTSCQAMAADLAQIKAEYGSDVNFVMLNVDNNKWLPEILRYRIDGIPHFVYLNRNGDAIAQTIGEQPRTILAADLDALVANAPLPHANATGKTSGFSAPTTPPSPAGADPRSHGAQVR